MRRELLQNGVFTGYRLKETDDELHLRDTTTNRVRRVAKSGIERVAAAGSVMPTGGTASLTRDDLRDLIRYLSGLGRAEDLQLRALI